MPRLPTMRVIGSHDISTSCDGGVGLSSRLTCVAIMLSPLFGLLYVDVVSLPSPSWLVTRGQLSTGMSPGRFLVERVIRQLAETPQGSAPDAHDSRREFRPGRLIHKWHEFVGKSRHGTANADATHIGTASDTIHPASLGNVAVHHRSPATQLHQAL